MSDIKEIEILKEINVDLCDMLVQFSPNRCFTHGVNLSNDCIICRSIKHINRLFERSDYARKN